MESCWPTQSGHPPPYSTLLNYVTFSQKLGELSLFSVYFWTKEKSWLCDGFNLTLSLIVIGDGALGILVWAWWHNTPCGSCLQSCGGAVWMVFVWAIKSNEMSYVKRSNYREMKLCIQYSTHITITFTILLVHRTFSFAQNVNCFVLAAILQIHKLSSDKMCPGRQKTFVPLLLWNSILLLFHVLHRLPAQVPVRDQIKTEQKEWRCVSDVNLSA